MKCIFAGPDEKVRSRIVYHGMQFFWAIDDALPGWLGWPFCWAGDFLEDFGLDRGLIRFNDDIMASVEAARAEREESTL